MIGGHRLHVRWIISLVISIQLWTGPSALEVLPPFIAAELRTSSIMDADLPHGVIAEGYAPVPTEHSALILQLGRATVNPALKTALPATEPLVLLPATNTALRIAMSNGDIAEGSSSEVIPIDARFATGDLSLHLAPFVITNGAYGGSATAQATTRTHMSRVHQPDFDPVLVDVWRRKGCHLNPANPSCLIVGAAAECAIASAGPACIADSDGDHCFDVAEVRVGLEPFDATDCISSTTGQPALNCLFLLTNLACNGDRIANPEESECAAQQFASAGHNPNRASECGVDRKPPLDDCEIRERDPTCDGFAPGYEGEPYG